MGKFSTLEIQAQYQEHHPRSFCTEIPAIKTWIIVVVTALLHGNTVCTSIAFLKTLLSTNLYGLSTYPRIIAAVNVNGTRAPKRTAKIVKPIMAGACKTIQNSGTSVER